MAAEPPLRMQNNRPLKGCQRQQRKLPFILTLDHHSGLGSPLGIANTPLIIQYTILSNTWGAVQCEPAVILVFI